MQYFAKLCCICEIHNCKINLTTTYDGEMKLLDKLKYCIPEIETYSTNSTKYICEKCVKKLDVVYNFKTSCIKTHKAINKYYGQLKNNSQHVETNLEISIHKIKEEIIPGDEINQSLEEQLGFSRKNIKVISSQEDNNRDTYTPNESMTKIKIWSPEINATKQNNNNSELLGFTQYEINASQKIAQQQFIVSQRVSAQKFINPKKFYCHYCNTGFTRKSNYNSHVLLHESSSPYVCTLCMKSFRYEYCLKDHINRHLNTQRYKCSHCSARFNTSRELYHHKIVQHSTKKHKCNICNKEFTFKSSLTKHLRIHSNIKFKCNICNKSFNTENCLKRHFTIHNSIKPYHCNTCGKLFKTRNYLKMHIASHEEPKFQCLKCCKFFKRRENLRAHMKLHERTPEVHHCDRCEETFPCKTQLKFHKRRKHRRQRLY